MQCLFVQGPTASGKTEVALSLAKQLSCEIISCDSIQVYKHTDIGSAKPTLKERQEVPHHLVDFVEPPKEYTAGEYRRDALQVLADLNDKKQKHCIIVGGTGFYFKALEFGMHEFPPTPKEIVKAVEEELASKGKEALYEELKNRDPEYAQKIAPQDSYRLQKAIEILRSSNSTPSQIRAQFVPQDFPYPIKKVVLQPNREELRDRVRRRFKKMWQNDFEEEVKLLQSKNLSNWAPMQSVGYKEVQDFIAGTITSYEELENLVVQKTMQLAKRQSTWFRKESNAEFAENPKRALSIFSKYI